MWSVEEEARTESRVTMELGGTELWPGHKFRLRYSVSLAEDGSLELKLNAVNCSEDKSLSFTSALHTYFRYTSIRVKKNFQLQIIFVQSSSCGEGVYPRVEGSVLY